MPGSLSLSVEDFNAGFVFANNPVVVKATNLEFNGLFRKVIFEVTTLYNKVDSNSRTYTFEVGADGLSSTDTVRCDISSALRSALARYEYSPEDVAFREEFAYPTVLFRIQARLRDFYNGVVDDGPTSTASGLLPDGSSTEYFSAFLGGLSDMERWAGGNGINGLPIPTSFSTKPVGEILDRDQLIVDTRFDSTIGYVKSIFYLNSDGGSRQRSTILFVNSRGVYETISILPAESEEYEIVSEERNLVRDVSYRPSPYTTSRKEISGAVWKMSSGWVNRDWAGWYTREFLMAKHYWLCAPGMFLPIIVTPDSESVMIYNKSDPSLISVNFTARAAIRG